MEIEEAFTTEAINAAGTNVADDEEERLRAMIRHVFDVEEVTENTTLSELEDLSVLMFVAGRTHQVHRTRFPFLMTPELANQFMEFLVSGFVAEHLGPPKE